MCMMCVILSANCCAVTIFEYSSTDVTLLRPWQTRTHCCRHKCFPFARMRNICCGHKLCVRDTKNVSEFVQKHFVSATNVSQFAQPKKHHGQQCVLVYLAVCQF